MPATTSSGRPVVPAFVTSIRPRASLLDSAVSAQSAKIEQLVNQIPSGEQQLTAFTAMEPSTQIVVPNAESSRASKLGIQGGNSLDTKQNSMEIGAQQLQESQNPTLEFYDRPSVKQDEPTTNILTEPMFPQGINSTQQPTMSNSKQDLNAMKLEELQRMKHPQISNKARRPVKPQSAKQRPITPNAYNAFTEQRITTSNHGEAYQYKQSMLRTQATV